MVAAQACLLKRSECVYRFALHSSDRTFFLEVAVVDSIIGWCF